MANMQMAVYATHDYFFRHRMYLQQEFSVEAVSRCTHGRYSS
jgi:hypothetical protein